MMDRLAGATVALCGYLLVTATTSAQPANPVAESQLHLQAAAEAYREGDLPAVVRSLEAAYELNPASLYTRRNLAAMYARTGAQDSALDVLEGLVEERLDFGMAENPDFAALREEPRFAALVERLDALTRPILRSEPYVEFELLGLAPEGIAFDAGSGRFFFGSMRSGDVFVLDDRLQVSRFGTIDERERLAAIGMTVDAGRGLLWVVGAGFELAANFDPEDHPGSGLFGFDLATGERVREYRVADADANFNDVTLGPDGSLYVSGSPVRRLDEDAEALLPLPGTSALFGANGLAVDAANRTLFVAAYPVTVAAIDLATGRTRNLRLPVGLTLYGVDGLYWHAGGLVAVQNGARPWRLLRLELDAAHDAVTGYHILELGAPATTPMTGAIVGNSIYYIGEGPEPAEIPAHFPRALRQSPGSVVIRKASLVP